MFIYFVYKVKREKCKEVGACDHGILAVVFSGCECPPLGAYGDRRLENILLYMSSVLAMDLQGVKST